MNNPSLEYLNDIETVPEDGIGSMVESAADSYEEEEAIYKANEHGTGMGDLRVSTGEGTYNPQHLNARHREIIRLKALGYKHVQIASMLSISPVTVGYVVNSPLGQDFLAEIGEARTGSVKDVHNRLQEMSPFAAEVMLDIMANSDDEKNRLRASEKVLEMAGHKAVDKHAHVHTHLSADEIKQIKDTAGGPETVSETPESQEVQQAEVVEDAD